VLEKHFSRSRSRSSDNAVRLLFCCCRPWEVDSCSGFLFTVACRRIMCASFKKRTTQATRLQEVAPNATLDARLDSKVAPKAILDARLESKVAPKSILDARRLESCPKRNIGCPATRTLPQTQYWMPGSTRKWLQTQYWMPGGSKSGPKHNIGCPAYNITVSAHQHTTHQHTTRKVAPDTILDARHTISRFGLIQHMTRKVAPDTTLDARHTISRFGQ